MAPSTALANPAGGVVAAGEASIIASGNKLNIGQKTDRAVIDWRSFNIGMDEQTRFYQPSAASIVLNRVKDVDPSRIEGTLVSNGHVMIVNPNGVLFGKGSRVDVGGLTATTANIRTGDFMSGHYDFNQPGREDASVINEGTITAREAGLVNLVAPHVENRGTITARLGKAQLASGETFTLDLANDGLLEVAVDSRHLPGQSVKNSGTIRADGGQVTLTAAAARDVVDSLITNTGVIEADTIGMHKGNITLYAHGSNAVHGNVQSEKGLKDGASAVTNSGILRAKGDDAGEQGGSIQLLGDHVENTGTAIVNASGQAGGGEVLIGGNYRGTGDIPTAVTNTVDKGAVLKADALWSGDGGRVIVWSDGTTDFGGSIFARGSTGAQGGFVETSGHNLTATGTVLAGALDGTAGEWLIDPVDITINQADCAGTNCASADSIVTSLQGGSNVTITTDSSTGGNGDITLNGDIIATLNTSDVTLALKAYRSITVNSTMDITATGSKKLNILFDADADAATAAVGQINISGDSNFTSNNGFIVLGGGSGCINASCTDYAWGQSAFDLSGISVGNTTAFSAGGGDIVLNGHGPTGATNSTNGISVGNTSFTTTGSGSITLRGVGGGSGTGTLNKGVYFGNAVTVTAGNSGAINIIGTGGAARFACYGIYMAGSTITANGSTVTLTGTGGGGGGASTNADNNFGVDIDASSSITTNGTGAITITGIGGGVNDANADTNYGVVVSNNSSILSTSSGPINIYGTQGGDRIDTNYGIFTNTNTNTIGHGTDGTYTGALTLKTDRVSFAANTIIKTDGPLAVYAYTGGTALNVGSNTGGLDLDSTTLGYMNLGRPSSITFGDATNTGAMDINTTVSFSKPVSFLTKSGSAITVAGDITSTSTGSAVTLTSGGGITLNANADITNNTSGSISIDANGTLTTSGTNIIGNAANGGMTGGITLIADAITLGAANTIKADGALLVKAHTSGTSFSLNNANTIDLSSAELGYFDFSRPSSITFGDTTNTGAMSINYASTWSRPVSFLTKSGADINLWTNLTSSYGTNAGAAFTFISGQDISVATGVTIDHTAANGTAVNALFEAYRNIVFNGNSTVTSTGGVDVNLTFDADADAATAAAGFVALGTGAFTTSGGNVAIGGGTACTSYAGCTDYAWGTATTNATTKVGVSLSGTSINAGGGSIKMLGKGFTGGTDFGSAYGVSLGGGASLTTSGSGQISLTGVGGGNGTGADNDGVILTTASITMGTSGSLSITGTGGAADDNNTGIIINPATITANGSTVTLFGTGGGGDNGDSDNNMGLYMNASTITTNGTGAFNITGIGGGANDALSNNNRGMLIGGNSNIISTSSGPIDITSYLSSANSNQTAPKSLTTSGGTNTIGHGTDGTYTGALTLTLGRMDSTTLAANTVIKTSGALTVKAATSGMPLNIGSTTSGIDLSDTYLGYLNLANPSSITFGDTTLTGAMNINTTVTFSRPVSFLTGSAAADITVAGNITSSYGANGGNAITIKSGRDLTVNTGVIINHTAVDGTTVNTVLDAIRDINFSGTSKVTSTGGVNVNVTMATDYNDASADTGYISLGSGAFTTSGGNFILGGGTSPSTDYAWGDAITSTVTKTGVTLTSTSIDAGGGSITINGKGYTGGTDVSNAHGVYMNTSASLTTTGSGQITLRGTGGGNGTGDINIGLWIDASTITAGASGAISMTGTGGAADDSNLGIQFTNSTVTANGSHVTLFGTGGGGSNADSDANYGVDIHGSTITTNGTGAFDITAIGGGSNDVNSDSSYALFLVNGSILSTSSGPINITSYANPADPLQSNKFALVLGGGTNTIGHGTDGTYTGDLTLALGTGINLGGTTPVIKTSGALTVKAALSGTALNVGSNTGGIDLSSGVLTLLNLANPSSITFGDTTNTGAMNINYTTAFSKPVLFKTKSGSDITVAGNLNSSYATNGGTSFTFVSGQDLTVNTGVTIDHTAVNGTTISALFEAYRNIIFSGTSKVTSTGGVDVNVTLDADADAATAAAGYVSLGSGAFTTSGGNFAIGGGTACTTYAGCTDYAWGDATTSTITQSGVTLTSTSINAGGGNIIINGKGYTGGTDFSNAWGVNLSGGSLTTSGSGQIIIKGTGGAQGTGDGGIGVQSTASITIGSTGLLDITGTGGFADDANYGINLDSGGAITANGGQVHMVGTGGGGDNNASIANVGLRINGASITTNGTGAIDLTGIGGGTNDAASTTNRGLQITGTGSILSTSSGPITLTGYINPAYTNQSWGTNDTGGIFIQTGTNTVGHGTDGSYTGALTIIANTFNLSAGTVFKTDGALVIKPYSSGRAMNIGGGSGGLDISSTYLGYFNLDRPSSITFGDNTVTGAMNINYTTAFSKPVAFKTAAGNNITVAGNLNTSYGTNGGTAFTFVSGQDLTVNTGVTIDDTAANGTAVNILMQAYRNLIFSGTSKVTSSGGVDVNVTLDADADAATAAAGYVSLGSGAFTTSGGNFAIGGGTACTTYAGCTDYAWGSATTSQDTKDGITLNSTSIDVGSGSIKMLGKGFTGAVDFGAAWGIYLGSSTLTTSGSGQINLTGTGGGNGTGSFNYGVHLFVTAINGGNSGAINITGTGGAADDSNYGVRMNTATITANGSSVTINGTGGGGNNADSDFNVGVWPTASTISTNGTGAFNITGIGGGTNDAGSDGNAGVRLENTTSILSTSSGPITITAYANPAYTLQDDQGSLVTINGTNTIGHGTDGTYTGDLTLVLDREISSLNAGTVIKTSGALTVKAAHSGTAINIGGSNTGGIDLNSGVLAFLNLANPSSITFGDATNTGAMNINYTTAFSRPVSFITGSATADITVAGNITSSYGTNGGSAITIKSGRDLTVNTGVIIDHTAVDGTTVNTVLDAIRDINFSGTSKVTSTGGVNVNVTMATDYNDASADTGYISLGSGAFTTSGGNFILGGGTSPSTDYAWGDATTSTITKTGVTLTGTSIDAGGGSITLNGKGYTGGTDFGTAHGIYINTGASLTTTGSGQITLRGTGGGNGTGDSNIGIWINASTITAGTSGSISMTGTGGAADDSNYGIILTSSTVTANGSPVTILATGGGGSNVDSDANYGLRLETTSTITTNGTGAFDITAICGGANDANSDTNYAMILFNGSILSTSSGPINITSYANPANPLQSNKFALVLGGGTNTIGHGTDGTYTGDLTLALGTGISLGGASPVIKTSGALTVKAALSGTALNVGSNTGGLDLDSTTLGYMNLANPSSITFGDATNTGAMNINYTTAFSRPVSFITKSGSDITLANTLNTSATGNAVTFNSGNDIIANTVNSNIVGSSTGAVRLYANRSILFSSSADITTQGGAILLNSDRDGLNGGAISLGSGTVLTSNGGAITLGGGTGTISANSGYATGTASSPQGIVMNGARLTSGAGNVILNGTGYTGTGVANLDGILIENGGDIDTTSGTITLNGIGGNGDTNGMGYYNTGVYLYSAAYITSDTGNIVVNGTGMNNTGALQYGAGVSIQDTSYVASTGTGGSAATITITGIGSQNGANGNYGITMYSSSPNAVAAVRTVDGNITMSGTDYSTGNINYAGIVLYDRTVESTGSGSITLNGISPSGTSGIRWYNSGSYNIGGPSATGNITFNADTIYDETGNLAPRTTGTVTFAPRTTGTTMGVGSASSGTLKLSDTLLNNINASAITFGDATYTGAMNINTGVTFSKPVSFKTKTGSDITVAGNLTSSYGTNGGTAFNFVSGQDITVNTGVTINHTAANGTTINTLIQAYRNIIFSGTSAVTSSGGVDLNLTFDADADAATAAAGYIDLGNGAFTTSGGWFVAGGGTDPLNDYAWGTSLVVSRGITFGAPGSSINTGGGSITMNGHGYTGGVNVGDAVGIYTYSTMLTTSGSGVVTLNGIGGGNGTGDNSYGLQMFNTGITTGSTGAINLTGTGGAGDDSNIGVHLSANLAPYTITANGSPVTILGTGGGGSNADSDSNRGVYISGATITTNGTGAINVTGIGGGANDASSDQNYGVYLFNGSSILSTSNGQINITGYVATANSSQDDRVSLKTFTGTNTIGHGTDGTYTGALTLALDNEDSTALAANTVIKTDGALVVKAAHSGTAMNIGSNTGGLDLSDTYLGYMNLSRPSSITFGDATNTGAMNINSAFSFTKPVSFITRSGSDITIASGLTSSASGNAITFTSGNDILSSSTGTIQASGTGAVVLQANNSILYPNSADITTQGGAITLNSDRDASGAGAIVLGSGTVLTSNGGNIILGGGATPATGYAVGTAGNTHGIYNIGLLSAGAGTITLHGQGFANPGGAKAYGVWFETGSAQTTSGDINIYGTGGANAGSDNGWGVFLGQYSATPVSRPVVSTTGGNITLNGQTTSPSGGVVLNYADVTTTGSGAVTITGSGYSTSGVFIERDSNVITADGNIAISGTGVGGNPVDGVRLGTVSGETTNVVKSTGAGTITLTGVASATGKDLDIFNHSNLIGVAGASGDITFNADTYTFSVTPTITTTGTVTFKPRTVGTSVGVGDASTGTLKLTDAVLNAINAGTLVIGDATNTGAMNINTAASSFAEALSFLTRSGSDITIASGLTSSASGNAITFTSGNDILDTAGLVQISSGSGGIRYYANNSIVFSGSADVTTTGGAILLNADRDGVSGGAISLGSGTVLTSNGGAITLGGGTGVISANSGYAVGTSANPQGINLDNAQLLSSAGNIIMNGTGWSNAATGNLHGVYLQNGAIVQSTSGAITAYGQGGTGNAQSTPVGVGNIGIFVRGSGSKFSAGQGAISLNGTGGSGNAVYNEGVVLYTSGKVESTGTGGSVGGITVNATGGSSPSNAVGFDVESSGSLTTVDGNVAITGTYGTGAGNSAFNSAIILFTSGSVLSTGSGNITMTAIGSGTGGQPFYFGNGTAIGGASDTGNITLVTNGITNGTVGYSIQTTGGLTIKPYTIGTSVGVGDASSGVLKLSDAVLSAINAGSLTIGDTTNTGAMNVNYTTAFSKPVSFKTNGSTLTVAGALTGTGSGSFAFTGPTTLSNNITTANQGITFNSAVTLGADSVLNAGSGTLTFGSTVNGGFNLTATAGTFSLASAWGGTTALGTVSLTSTNGLTLPAITANSITASTSGATADLTIGNILTVSNGTTGVLLTAGRDLIANTASSNIVGSSAGTVTLRANNSILYTNGGDITTQGGAITLNSDRDASSAGAILLDTGTVLTSNNADITLGGGANPLTANAWGTSSNVEGVKLNNAQLTSGTGAISLRGHGWNDAATSSHYGISLLAGATLTSTTGAITVNGTGGSGVSDNTGYYSNGNTTRITSTDGDITVDGTGGINTGGSNFGINLAGQSGIRSTGVATGGGTITVTGTGGTGGGIGTSNNHGIILQGGGSYITSAATGAGAKNIIINGTAGNASNNNYGVLLANTGDRITSADADITITGTGAGINGFGIGVYLNGGYVTTSGTGANAGNIVINGTGSSAGGNGNEGVRVAAWGSAQAISTVDGNITVSGTGGSNAGTGNHGIYVRDTALYVPVVVVPVVIQTTGSGNLTLTGIAGPSASSKDLYLERGSYGSQLGSATMTGAITINANTIYADAGNTIRTNGALTFAPRSIGGTVGIAGGAGALDLSTNVLNAITNAGSVTIGRADGQGAITANAYTWAAPLTLLTSTGGININGAQAMGANAFLARTYGASDITIGASGGITSTGAGTPVTLVSGHNFINNSGSSAPFTTANGRWLVYSTSPANDTMGTLAAYSRFFSCTYGGSCPAGVAADTTHNLLLYSATPTLTVTPDAISDITYGDAVPSLNGYGYTVSGYATLNGATLTVADSAHNSPTGTLDGSTTYTQGSNVGSYNIDHASGTLTSAMGYGYTYANNATAFSVGQRTITATLTGTASKTYDAGTAATLTSGNYNLANVYNSDDVVIGGAYTSGTYDDKNVNTGKNVSVAGLSLGGTKAGNYTLASAAINGNIGTITARALTINGVTAQNKTYDGTAAALLDATSASLVNAIGGDAVSLNSTGATGVFANVGPGTGIAVTASGFALAGLDAGNYTLSQPVGLAADIAALHSGSSSGGSSTSGGSSGGSTSGGSTSGGSSGGSTSGGSSGGSGGEGSSGSGSSSGASSGVELPSTVQHIMFQGFGSSFGSGAGSIGAYSGGEGKRGGDADTNHEESTETYSEGAGTSVFTQSGADLQVGDGAYSMFNGMVEVDSEVVSYFELENPESGTAMDDEEEMKRSRSTGIWSRLMQKIRGKAVQ